MPKSKAKEKDRKKISVPLSDSFSLKELDGYSMDQAIAFFERYKEQYEGREVYLHVQGIPYEDYDEYVVCERRLENDEEWALRMKKEEEWTSAQEARDRAQFEALSKKFGSGG